VLDRIGQWVKRCPRNVARLGTGRGIGENLVIWAGVACFLRLARFLALLP